MTAATPAGAAHQLQVRGRSHGMIVVTCTCLIYRTRMPEELRGIPCWQRGPFRSVRVRGIIEERRLFPAAEAVAAWRAWHEREGIEL